MIFRNLSVVGMLCLVSACNSNDFAGGSSERKAPNAAPQKNATSPSDDANPSSSDPSLGNPDTTNPTSTSGTTPQDGATPNTGTSTSKPSISDLFDILAQSLKVNKDVAVDQPNENEIVFGGNRVFHIGDNNFGNSTCKMQIVPYAISGTKYYFEFEVKKDNTEVSIVIEKVCGVDHGDSNFLSLMSGTNTVDSMGISKGATSLNFSAKASLAAGTYVLLVESRGGSQEPGTTPTDHDDYIVGKIQIKASGPIKPGAVGARN